MMSATIVKRPVGRPRKTPGETKQKNTSTVTSKVKKQCLRETEDVFRMMPDTIVKRPVGRPKKTPGESKRKITSAVTNKVKKQCLKKKEDIFSKDQYCWMCHELAQDRTCSCQRVYHNKCLASAFKEFKDEKCPECQIVSVDGAHLNRPFSGLLQCLLENVTKRIIVKKCKKNSVCLRWPDQSRNVKKIDLPILLEKIKNPANGKEESYTSPSSFFSEVKWIYHNCCIVYGEKSEHSQNAKELVACFKDELSEIEACPECYYHLFVKSSLDIKDVSDTTNMHEGASDVINSEFVRLCKPPHDVVWAKVRGHKCYPAKCLKVVNGVALVRFFGKFERANLPVENVFHITEINPQNEKDKVTDDTRGRLSHQYHLAKRQLIMYIQIYKEEFGHGFPFLQSLVPYHPEGQNEMTGIQHEDLSTSHQNLSEELDTARNVDPTDKWIDDIQIITSTRIVASEIVAGPSELVKTAKSKSNIKKASSNISVNMTFSEVPDPEDPIPSYVQDTVLPSRTTLMKEVVGTRHNSPFSILGSSKDDNCNMWSSRSKNTLRSVIEVESKDDDDDDIIILDTPSTSSNRSNVEPNSAVLTPSQKDAAKAVAKKNVTEDASSCNSLLDPSTLLSCVLKENQHIDSLVQDGKSFLDAFILCLLSEASNHSGAPGALMNKLIAETTKLKSELVSLRREKEEFQGAEKQLKKNVHELQMSLCMEKQNNTSLESKNIDLEKRERELIKKNTVLENNNKHLRKLVSDFKYNSESSYACSSGGFEQPLLTPTPVSHSSGKIRYPDGKLPLAIQPQLSKSAVEAGSTNALSSKICQKDLHGRLGNNQEIVSRCGCGDNNNKCTVHQSKDMTPRWWFNAS